MYAFCADCTKRSVRVGKRSVLVLLFLLVLIVVFRVRVSHEVTLQIIDVALFVHQELIIVALNLYSLEATLSELLLIIDVNDIFFVVVIAVDLLIHHLFLFELILHVAVLILIELLIVLHQLNVLILQLCELLVVFVTLKLFILIVLLLMLKVILHARAVQANHSLRCLVILVFSDLLILFGGLVQIEHELVVESTAGFLQIFARNELVCELAVANVTFHHEGFLVKLIVELEKRI